MRLESKSRFKTNKMAGNNRKRPPYGMLLLLALGAAVLSVVLLHKMREKRVLSLLLQDRDQQLLALELLLQREKENTKEIKRKLEALKAKTTSLRSEKTELNSKLIETEGTITYLKRTQKELEAALGEKQNQINELEKKAAESTASKLQITTLTELVKEKEAKIEEMKHHLLNLQPSENTASENNIASRNGDVIDHRKENVTSENVQLEEHSSSGGESSIIEAKQVNSGETGSNQPDDIPKEGTWVTFQTNLEDEGLKNETGRGADQNAGASGDNQLEKVEVSQESEDSGQSKETDQGSSVEIKEQWLESTNGKQIGKIGENSNDTEGQDNVTEHVDAEKLQDPQNGNEQKLTSADLKLAEKNDLKMSVGQSGRTKTKSRRRWRVSKEELEKHDSMHFEISQNNENQLRQKEHEDNSKEEIYRKDRDFNDNHLNMIESSQVTGNSIVGDGRDDGDASKSREQILLPQHDSMETVTNFNDNKVSETSLESKEFLQVDDGVGVRNDTGDKNEFNDIKQDSVSKSGNVEMPNDSQEKTQNPEGGEGLQDHGEDSFNETAQNGGEKIPSTYGNQVGSNNPHKNGVENKSDNNEDGITTDSINNSQSDAERKDGVIEQTMTANTISNPAETEAKGNTNDHQNQSKTIEEKTETVDSSNTGDDNEEEDKMIKKNAENNKSAEF